MNPRSALKVFVCAAMLLLLLSGEAHANIGIPMVVFMLPWMVASLAPVIVLESYVLRKRIPLTVKKSTWVATVANLVTTLLGVPVTWACLLGIEYVFSQPDKRILETPLEGLIAVTIQAPWMYKYIPHWRWMIAAAAIWLLIPFFFMSWWVEYLVAARMLKDADRATVKAAMLRGNLISYGGLECAAVALLIYEVTTGTFVALQ